MKYAILALAAAWTLGWNINTATADTNHAVPSSQGKVRFAVDQGSTGKAGLYQPVHWGRGWGGGWRGGWGWGGPRYWGGYYGGARYWGPRYYGSYYWPRYYSSYSYPYSYPSYGYGYHNPGYGGCCWH